MCVLDASFLEGIVVYFLCCYFDGPYLQELFRIHRAKLAERRDL